MTPQMSLMKNKKLLICALTLSLYSLPLCAKTVEYSFGINYKTVNYSGKLATAMTIDNQVPGPTIEAHVGDTLRVTFHNKMNVETSIHWHGILLPNDQDGVPYITTPPIKKQSSLTYQFNIKQAGTYWYHSHTGLQEQRGVYGSIIFHPQDGEKIKTDRDYVIVFSDWINEKPSRVLANLKRDGDYYALKKGTVLSWNKVLGYGWPGIKNRLRSSLNRMGPMDISDIGYDAFLSNGKQKEHLAALPEELIRLRLINAAASTYFNIEFAGGPMTIVSADGIDIVPQKVKRLRIAVAETYDVIVKTPANESYELRATAEDGTGYSSTYIGNGKIISAPDIARPNLFLMHHDMHKDHKDNDPGVRSHKHHVTGKSIIQHMTNYEQLRSLEKTALPKGKPTKKMELTLTGAMDRYRWSFDNKTFLEKTSIHIKKGENIHLVLRNKTMMHHPIHIHGHFFQILNKHGDYGPLKHTVDVPAMGQLKVAFNANEDKHWLLHCHNLYHMHTGMMRVVSYEHSTPLSKKAVKQFAHNPWYQSWDFAMLSQMMMGEIRISNTRNAFELEYDYNYKDEYDIEIKYLRNFTRFFDAYIEAEFEQHDCTQKCTSNSKNTKSSKNTIACGIRYVLPILIRSELRINSKGVVRLDLRSNLQLASHCLFEWQCNTDNEYRFALSFEANKNFLLTVAYDSDFKWGAGLRIRF